jgi:uroporphyrinogen III methyltransferase/synthase
VTRAAGQAEEFSARLREAGAVVLEYPVIEIGPPASWEPVDAAIASLSAYDWIVFTSANAARIFWDRAGAAVTGARVCAVGPATGRAVEAAGRRVDLVPGEFVGEGALASLRQAGVAGQRVLLPRATVARDVLPDGLREAGAQVDVVDVYRNVLPASPAPFPEAVDWVTFTSASTVKNLLVLAGREVLEGVKIGSIGPQTSAVLRMHELPVTVEAEPSTTEGLLDAMLHYLPLGDALDLHAFAPRDMRAAVEAFLEHGRDQRLTALRIIHGRGIGAQREMVRKMLAATPWVASFEDAPMEAGGWGATVVTLKPA